MYLMMSCPRCTRLVIVTVANNNMLSVYQVSGRSWYALDTSKTDQTLGYSAIGCAAPLNARSPFVLSDSMCRPFVGLSP